MNPIKFEDRNFNNGKEIFAIINYIGDPAGCKKGFELLQSEGSPLKVDGKTEFAMIIHLEDISPDTGSVEIPHIHLFARFDKGHSKRNYIEMFSEFLGLKPQAIQMQALSNDIGAIRYLGHLDEKGRKTPHTKEEVVTNIPAEVERAWSLTPTKKATDWSVDDLLQCNSLREVVELVGLTNYHKAKELYNDLRTERTDTEIFEKHLRAIQHYALELDVLIQTFGDDVLKAKHKDLKERYNKYGDLI